MSQPTRVVVTGLGLIGPTGNTVQTSWDNIKNGRSGIGPITLFDATNLETKIAGEVKNFDPKNHLDPKEARRMERFSQLAIVAAREAVNDANLTITDENSERIAVLIGSAGGAATAVGDNTKIYETKGPRRVSPIFLPMMLVDTAGALVAIDLGIRGPNFAIVSACATGTNSIGEAAEYIKRGDADIALCGGTDAPLFSVAIAGFNIMGVLSRRNDEPAAASRPFDLNRDGFVLSEGAGVLVLESEEHALARGAKIYSVLSGYGTSADAVHFAAMDTEAGGIARSMKWALRKANLDIKDIGYINPHGTGTKLNDVTETTAIKQVFGEEAYNIPVSSTKSMTGHMMGASGAAEAIFSILALNEEIIPPTINYTTPDPNCDLDYVPNQARTKRFDHAMSNSIGLGGHNATIIVSRYN
ncbi:MAG TPA: beta-ketoacyl-ACP synthase II [Anaerolineae bacterium]|nr:beta-ketoacyl-ACP synthase II [Anaerolineae bacterium]